MVTIYTPEGHCSNCEATKRALDSKGIVYVLEVMGEEHPKRKQFRAQGFAAFPVVVTESGSWCGFRPDKILELVSVA